MNGMFHQQSIDFLNIESQENQDPLCIGFLYREQMDIANWVKAARTHKNWTQGALGDALSLSKGNISGWENRKHEPSFQQIVRIAQLTGFPIELPPGLCKAAGRPFSGELLAAVAPLAGDDLRRAENALRAHLDLPTLSPATGNLAAA